MKIAVDIDDTLNILDRVGRASAYIERNHLPFRLKNPDAAALTEVFDWGYDDVLKFVREGGVAAFTDAEARRGAKEALASWRAAGHVVVILTARTKEWFGNPERVSRDWLEKRKIPYDALEANIPYGEKGKYCAEHGIGILIDDNVNACLDAQARGVRAVLAVGRHNAARAREVAYGGVNWKQIDAVVRHFLTNTPL